MHYWIYIVIKVITVNCWIYIESEIIAVNPLMTEADII